MFNEAVRIASIAGCTTQADFQRGEWAHPSGQFDEGSPAGDRYVAQRNPGRAGHNEAAENDESDKQEMQNQNGVCQESIDHQDTEICLVCTSNVPACPAFWLNAVPDDSPQRLYLSAPLAPFLVSRFPPPSPRSGPWPPSVPLLLPVLS